MKAKAVCDNHYQNLRRTGEPEARGIKTGTSSSGYRLLKRRHHPLADAGGTVYEHRLVLFEAIGEGAHQCAYCDRTVAWLPGNGVRRPASLEAPWALEVDHVDGDRRNNDPRNLVPACHRCNNAMRSARRSSMMAAAA